MVSEKKVKWLKQVSILSLLLNVVLFCLFYVVAFNRDMYRGGPSAQPLIAKSQHCECFPEDFLDTLAQSSLEEVVALLNEDRLLYGYPLKIWALSIAIHMYHVDISPVLSHAVEFVELRSGGRRWLLPQISLQEFQAVQQFLSLEKYPFTSLGMFLLLAQEYREGIVEEGCYYAFCCIPEFLYFRTLLAGADTQVTSLESLVGMVIRGGHDLFFSLCNDQTRVANISDADRRHVLWEYIQRDEPLAADLLLVHDEDWVLHELSDPMLRHFLSVLSPHSVHRQALVTRVLHSPRNYVMNTMELNEDATLLHQESPLAPQPKYIEYAVVQGDSLWLLAHRFQVKIQDIMDANHLTHDRLSLGQVLRIPVVND